MIAEGLKAMLFGMLGIFTVMSVIIVVVLLLNRLGKREQGEQ